MSFNDTLLVLTSYPEPTPCPSLEQAVALGAALGASLSAISFEVEMEAPGRFNFLANRLLDLPGIIAAERKKSADNARALLDSFENIAKQRGVFAERIIERCMISQVPNVLVDHARLRDLTIIPVHVRGGIEQWYAESVIFGSGRPAMILPDRTRHEHMPALQTVAIAWDFSRPAARAVADALPILERAKTVRAVTVTREKKIETMQPKEQLAKHLKLHGVDIALDMVDAQGRSIGDVLEAYVELHNADLLVMGAYGHSRVRDFILGGATKSMLSKPPVPVFLSH
jgi:nucleotide-binding universal stress UspA family protein